MAENLQQKQHAKTQVDRQLARLEEQIFTLEGQYLDETANTGNVVVVRPSARSDSCYLISLFHLCVSASVCLPLCLLPLFVCNICLPLCVCLCGGTRFAVTLWWTSLSLSLSLSLSRLLSECWHARDLATDARTWRTTVGIPSLRSSVFPSCLLPTIQ